MRPPANPRPKKLSHHAYLAVGGRAEAAALRAELAASYGFKTVGDPDFIERAYGAFAIADARDVQSLAETRAARPGGDKLFLLAMDGITVDAQNALLKLLEEPGEGVRFFIVIPSAHLLLPTVRSRMASWDAHSGGAARKNRASARVSDAGISALAERFLAAPPKARLEIAKSFADEIGAEKRPKRDAIELMCAIEEAVYARPGGVRKNAAALEAVLMAEGYATDRAPSLKMLLEYLALAA